MLPIKTADLRRFAWRAEYGGAVVSIGVRADCRSVGGWRFGVVKRPIGALCPLPKTATGPLVSVGGERSRETKLFKSAR